MNLLSNAGRDLRRTIRRHIDLAADEGPAFDIQTYETLRGMRAWAPGDLVFDVGANDGRTVLRLMRHLPSPRIFAFEPASAPFAMLTRRTSHLPGVSRYQLALGEGEAERTLYINELSALNSLRPDWHGGDKQETVRMTSLDQVMARENPGPVRLLKIDAEGHDLEVLKGAAATLSKGMVDIIEVEAGFSAPGPSQPSLEDFRRFLEPYGYYLYAIHNQCRGRRLPPCADGSPAPQVLVYCDALFVSARASDPGLA